MASKKPLQRDPAPSVVARARAIRALLRYEAIIPLLAIGFIGGFLWLVGMRILLVRAPETHYHANFAVYINGEREDFSEFTYYEEVAACTGAYADNPKGRVHMHDEVDDIIHVHDKRVSYGAFFQNIGWGVGDEYLATLDRLYQTDADTKVTYILNGETVDSIGSRLIGNMDRLLVSYGPADSDFLAQYNTVASTAPEVNKYQDPATCGGLNGAGSESFGARLKRATFWY